MQRGVAYVLPLVSAPLIQTILYDSQVKADKHSHTHIWASAQPLMKEQGSKWWRTSITEARTFTNYTFNYKKYLSGADLATTIMHWVMRLKWIVVLRLYQTFKRVKGNPVLMLTRLSALRLSSSSALHRGNLSNMFQPIITCDFSSNCSLLLAATDRWKAQLMRFPPAQHGPRRQRSRCTCTHALTRTRTRCAE